MHLFDVEAHLAGGVLDGPHLDVDVFLAAGRVVDVERDGTLARLPAGLQRAGLADEVARNAVAVRDLVAAASQRRAVG